MTDVLEQIHVASENINNALGIPVSLAFDEVYRRKPGIKSHKHFDDSHSSLRDTYLATRVVYACLYGKSPVGTSYDYLGRFPEEEAAFLHKIPPSKFFGQKK